MIFLKRSTLCEGSSKRSRRNCSLQVLVQMSIPLECREAWEEAAKPTLHGSALLRSKPTLWTSLIMRGRNSWAPLLNKKRSTKNGPSPSESETRERLAASWRD